MSAPEPTAAEVIARVLRSHVVSGKQSDDRPWKDNCAACDAWFYALHNHHAEAVVAAIRAMSPAEQAELIGGEARTCLIDVTDHAGQPRRLRERNIVVLGWVDEVRDV